MNVPVIVATVLFASIIASAVLTAGIALLLRLRPFDATTRHALWFGALIAIAVFPLAGMGASFMHRAPAPQSAAAHHVIILTPPHEQHASPVLRRSAPAQAQPAASPSTRHDRFAWALPHITAAVADVTLVAAAAVALFGLGGLVLSIAQIGAVKRRSSPLDERLSNELPWLTETHRGRETYLRLSYEIEAPVAMGFGRPVILIPTELATHNGLTAIEDLVIHEHAHLRRYDDYTNVIQRVIERIFWFNPFVWIIGRRIALEREIAADDAVVARTRDRTRYADALWRLAREMRMPAYTLVAPGALFTRKQISVRIETLLAPGRAHLRRLGPASAAVALALSVLSCAIVAFAAPPLELPAPSEYHTAFVEIPTPKTPVHAGSSHDDAVALSALSGLISSRLADVASTANAPATAASPDRIAELRREVKVLQDKLAVMERMAREGKLRALQQRVEALQRSAQSIDASLRIRSDVAKATALAPTARTAPTAQTVPNAVIARTATSAVHPAVPRAQPRAATSAPGRTSHTAFAPVRPHASAVSPPPRFNVPRVSVPPVNVDVPEMNVNVPSVSVHTPAVHVHVPAVHVHVPATHADAASAAIAEANANQALSADTTLTRTLITRCVGCDLSHRDLRNVDLHGISLTGTNLHGADLRGANLRGAGLQGADLGGANLDGADLTGARLTGANIAGASFRGAKMDGVRFEGINLHDGAFDAAGVREILVHGCSGCNLSHMNLHGVDLHGVSLVGADFSHANLQGANLSGAHFSGVSFDGANLNDADLRNSSFVGCSLSGTSLNGARLDGIRLSGTSLNI